VWVLIPNRVIPGKPESPDLYCTRDGFVHNFPLATECRKASDLDKRVCQKSEFINFTLATATVNGVKLSKMDF
jgi:hypothetical protein